MRESGILSKEADQSTLMKAILKTGKGDLSVFIYRGSDWNYRPNITCMVFHYKGRIELGCLHCIVYIRILKIDRTHYVC